VIGIGLGAVLAGVSFGFTTGWRAWIRDRDPTGFFAQFVAIGLAMVVSIPLIASHEELSGAIAPLSVSLLIGASCSAPRCRSPTVAARARSTRPGSQRLFARRAAGLRLRQLPRRGAPRRVAGAGQLPPVSLPAKLGTAPALLLQLAAFACWRSTSGRSAGRASTRAEGPRGLHRRDRDGGLRGAEPARAGQPWGVVYGLGLWAPRSFPGSAST